MLHQRQQAAASQARPRHSWARRLATSWLLLVALCATSTLQKEMPPSDRVLKDAIPRKSYTDLANTIIELPEELALNATLESLDSVPTPDFWDQRLPYLFDSRLVPTLADACDTPCDKVLLKQQFTGMGWFLEPCCGVCFGMNRICAQPLDKMNTMLEMYRKAGFYFDGLVPNHLMQHVKGRTIWFVGDPQILQLYGALECFMRSYSTSGLKRHLGPFEHSEALHARWHSHFSGNCTASFFGYCLPLQRGGRLCAVKTCAASVAMTQLLPLLMEHHGALRDDIMFMHWGIQYSNERLKNDVIELAGYIKANRERLPRQVYWFQMPPWHFSADDGLINSYVFPGYKDCFPLQDFYDKWAGNADELRQGGTRAQFVDPVMREAGVDVFSVWNATVPLWFLHRSRWSRGDCQTYCSPGAPEVWVYMLWTFLEERAPSTQPAGGAR